MGPILWVALINHFGLYSHICGEVLLKTATLAPSLNCTDNRISASLGNSFLADQSPVIRVQL